MYDRILVPTDGSEGSLAALDHALGAARRNDAVVYALHVVRAEGISDALDDEAYSDALDRLERAGEEAVETIREATADADIELADASVVRGVPSAEILEYVTANDIDLIVMATEGRTGSERELIGSVTEEVVRTAPVPVLTVNVGRTDDASD